MGLYGSQYDYVICVATYLTHTTYYQLSTSSGSSAKSANYRSNRDNHVRVGVVKVTNPNTKAVCRVRIDSLHDSMRQGLYS